MATVAGRTARGRTSNLASIDSRAATSVALSWEASPDGRLFLCCYDGSFNPLSRAAEIFFSCKIGQRRNARTTRSSNQLVNRISAQESSAYLLGNFPSGEFVDASIEYGRREKRVCHPDAARFRIKYFAHQLHTLRRKALRITQPDDEQPFRGCPSVARSEVFPPAHRGTGPADRCAQGGLSGSRSSPSASRAMHANGESISFTYVNDNSAKARRRLPASRLARCAIFHAVARSRPRRIRPTRHYV